LKQSGFLWTYLEEFDGLLAWAAGDDSLSLSIFLCGLLAWAAGDDSISLSIFL